MENGKLLLSKIIEENKVTELSRFDIGIGDMHSEVDRNTYNFILKYSDENEGNAPSYATVAAEVEGFEYIPNVTDSYEYLAKQIKEHSMLTEVLDWFRKGKDGEYSPFEEAINEMGAEEFLKKWLPEQTDRIRYKHASRESVGTSIKNDQESYLEEYWKRKKGESFKIWKSKFSSIGEYVSSNLYTVYGKSGRGKSIITLEDGVYVASQGATVLLWALEMGMFEVLTRIYVSISGEEGISKALIKGISMDAGFDSSNIRRGSMSEEVEEIFVDFIENINEVIDGNIVVRAVDDIGFNDRSVRALQSDINSTKADFVIVDPFYYMDYEANTSRTTGGDAANTSEKLRIMAGTTETVIVAITQADETEQDVDEDGERELEIPKRSEVMKTKSLLQDAYLLIAVDTDYKQGRGLVGVNKGRDGGEGEVSEILFIPNHGIVKEAETGFITEDEFEF